MVLLFNMFTYPKQFSDSLWLPFSEGPRRDMINDRFSSFEDFTNTTENWFSITGYKYTPEEMKSRWGCLNLAKIRVEAYYRVSLGLFPAYDPSHKQIIDEMNMDIDHTPDFTNLLKPNCSEKDFKRFLAQVNAKESDGWDRLRASFDVVRGTGKNLTDSQWERLTGVPQVEDSESFDEPTPEEPEEDVELLTLTIDATGEQVDAIFLEDEMLFVTVEEEPRILNPEDVTL